MFYSLDEFNNQLSELVQTGMSEHTAYLVVRARERRDRMVYDMWVEESAQQLETADDY